MSMRVCLATDSREPSGVGEHMLVLADALRDRFDLVLACPDSLGGQGLLRRAARRGLGIKLLADDPETVAAWLRRTRCELLHLHAGIGWEAHGLAVAGRAAGIPHVVRTEHLPDLITDPLQRIEHAKGLALIDRVICVSASAADTYVARGLDHRKIVVVHNGLAYQPPLRTRAAVRAALGLGPRQPVLLTTARFTAQKDHATLLDAMPAVLALHPDAVLLLAGTGVLANDMLAHAAKRGVGAGVRFLGRRDDVPDLLAASDLFVLPSRFEGLPLAVIEAMAAGRPVVATRVGGTDEVVVHRETGLLVPPGDPAALANAIVAVLGDAQLAKTLAAAGRRRYDDDFTATRMVEETARLYSTLAGSTAVADRMDGMAGAEQARTRIGFVGVGGIAHRHFGVLEHFEDVELAAFADPAQERAMDAAARFGGKAYADVDAMLAAEKLDALYICVPPSAHGAPERAAIRAGLPFFVEKPLAVDLAVAEELAAAVAAAGLITGVGYHWRYLDTLDEARHLLADNPAQVLSGYWLDATPPPQWWWKQDQSGGQFNEQTTHIVDLARYLVGEVTQVFGLASHRPRGAFPGLDIPTASTASLKFASGAIANIASTCLLRWNHRVGLHVYGDGLAMEITDHDLMVDVGQGRPTRRAEGDPVWREDRDFVDAVRGGENRIRCPYPEALATLRITDAIRRSAETGQAITLPTLEAKHV